jgi:N-acyl-D-aspartate/D-glutamate deacylase
MSRRSGRPLNWNTVVQMSMHPDQWRPLLDFTRAAFEEERVQVWAMNTSQRRDYRINLGAKGDRPFRLFPVWQEALAGDIPERVDRLRDPAMRERLRAVMDGPSTDAHTDYNRLVIEAPAQPENRRLTGQTLAQLGRERGAHPLDAFLDLALSENLETGFKVIGVSNGDEEAVAQIITHPYSVAGLSDAGAHSDFLCAYDFPAEILGKWVRDKGVMSLEEGVRRLTSMPAAVAGLPNRGMLREGMAADLTIFDLGAIRSREPEVAHDLPGGAARLIQRCDGIAATVVNGEVFMREGEYTGARSGHVIRNGLASRQPARV